jgi:hypothetical protein
LRRSWGQADARLAWRVSSVEKELGTGRRQVGWKIGGQAAARLGGRVGGGRVGDRQAPGWLERKPPRDSQESNVIRDSQSGEATGDS